MFEEIRSFLDHSGEVPPKLVLDNFAVKHQITEAVISKESVDNVVGSVGKREYRHVITGIKPKVYRGIELSAGGIELRYS